MVRVVTIFIETIQHNEILPSGGQFFFYFICDEENVGIDLHIWNGSYLHDTIVYMIFWIFIFLVEYDNDFTPLTTGIDSTKQVYMILRTGRGCVVYFNCTYFKWVEVSRNTYQLYMVILYDVVADVLGHFVNKQFPTAAMQNICYQTITNYDYYNNHNYTTITVGYNYWYSDEIIFSIAIIVILHEIKVAYDVLNLHEILIWHDMFSNENSI